MSDKLAEWLGSNNLTAGDFAEMLFGSRKHRPNVHRYIKGIETPSRRNMERIISLTNGYVQPNDFYKQLTTEPRQKAATNNNTRKHKNENVRDKIELGKANPFGATLRRRP